MFIIYIKNTKFATRMEYELYKLILSLKLQNISIPVKI